MDKSILNRLGLDENEISIYLYLNKFGVQTVKQVSEGTLVNRTTTYRYLESLLKKGLVEWIIDERGKKIRTTSLESLRHLFQNKKSQLESIEVNLPGLVSSLTLQKPSEKFATQVRYFKNKEGIKQMIWNTLQAKETLRSYSNLRRREFIDPRFEDEFEGEWFKRRLKDRVITNESRIFYIQKRLLENYKKTLDIRIIPSKKFYITNDIIIYNNVLAIIALEENSLVGIEIENIEIAKTQKSIFNLVWETAKHYER